MTDCVSSVWETLQMAPFCHHEFDKKEDYVVLSGPESDARYTFPTRINVSPELVQTELAIEEYENKRMQKVQERMKGWQDMLERHFNTQFIEMQNKLKAIKSRQIEAEKLKEQHELMLREAEVKKQQELKEQRRITRKRLCEKMRRAHLKHKSQQEELLKAVGRLVEQSEQPITVHKSNLLEQKCQDWQMPVSHLKQRVEHCTEVQNAETLKSAEALLQEIIDNKGIEALNQELHACVDSDAFREYLELKAFHEEVEKAYEPLISDPELKKYRFDLQKAINTPLNALSACSGSHLRDKYERLLAVLSGYTVEVGEKPVNCRQHPQAIYYCMDLLAKKIVTQSEGQVASKFETAFPVATVAAGLWANFPDFGRLMLYHFYKRCPYLLPYYIPCFEGQSAEEHYKELGYLYNDDGVIEKQDQFLKRMSGYMRLYAAILQSSPPPGTSCTNPHWIQYGWKWLSRVLNLQPRPDITATLLFDFLEVAGHAMEQAYGKQFGALLQALCEDFFPEIKKITSASGVGPLTRLEDFLINVFSHRRMPPPVGLLKQDFWFT